MCFLSHIKQCGYRSGSLRKKFINPKVKTKEQKTKAPHTASISKSSQIEKALRENQTKYGLRDFDFAKTH